MWIGAIGSALLFSVSAQSQEALNGWQIVKYQDSTSDVVTLRRLPELLHRRQHDDLLLSGWELPRPWAENGKSVVGTIWYIDILGSYGQHLWSVS